LTRGASGFFERISAILFTITAWEEAA